MKLFTKAILNKMPKFGELAETKIEDIKVQVKLFDCMGSSKWFLYEYDEETGMAMAFCMLNGDYHFAELGSISIPEIQSVLGWRLERDRSFSPTSLEKVMEVVKSGGHL